MGERRELLVCDIAIMGEMPGEGREAREEARVIRLISPQKRERAEPGC